MKNVTVSTKKVNAGHYEVSVSNGETEVKFTETDMTVIDALNDEDGNGFYTQYEASNLLITKSGIEQ